MTSWKKKKRKNRSNDSDTGSNNNKQFKQRGPSEEKETHNLSVSDILGQTNSILYKDTLFDCDDSVFIENDNSTEKAEHLNSVESKMASNKQMSTTSQGALDSKLDTIINVMTGLKNEITDLKSSQDNMKRMFESKLDKLRVDLMANVDTKIRALRDELSIDLSRETNRIDQVVFK